MVLSFTFTICFFFFQRAKQVELGEDSITLRCVGNIYFRTSFLYDKLQVAWHMSFYCTTTPFPLPALADTHDPLSTSPPYH